MSKKKQQKKHAFKHSTPSLGDSPRAEKSSPSAARVEPVQSRQPIAKPTNTPAGLGDFSYVGHDLRKISYLAVGFVAGELILWYLINYTAFGGIVYGLIKA